MRKSFMVLLAAELLLLLIGIVGLFGKNTVYQYGAENMQGNFGAYREDLGGWYVDEACGQTGNAVDFTGIFLPRGIYQVSLHYSTDTDMKNRCTITDELIGYKALLTNGEHFYSALQETDFQMWLLEDSKGLIVHAVYEGEGALTVTGLTVSETNAGSRIWIFCVMVGSLLLNSAYFYRQYDREHGISVKNKIVAFGLGLIVLFASLPLMLDYMGNGGDLVYHLMRIEGIKDGILSGQFPVRIAPKWQQGYGYASSVFYGETLLYLAAFFRMTGFDLVTSYRLFFFVMTVAQVGIAYFCFWKIFQEKYIGLFCTALYTLSVYRIYKTYICGSFGESFGVLFLPFLVYGFYRVFTQDISEKTYRRSWIPLTIGFTGLIQSHFLTGELAGFFTILLCIWQFKKVFRKETFCVLAKTVIYSCLLSAWFLVPFADYMLTGDFVIQHVSGRTIQERGLYLAHLLYAYSRDGANVFYEESGMANSNPTNMGIALVAVLLLWLGLCFFRKNQKLSKEMRTLGKVTATFGILSMVMSLSVFPWDKIQSLGGIAATLVSSLQFPNRVLTIANASLVTLAGVAAVWAYQQEKTAKAAYFGGVLVLLAISSLYLNTDVLYQAGGIKVYNAEGMGTGNIAGAEYLPFGADAARFVHRNPIAGEEVSLTEYDKQGLQITFSCRNTGNQESMVDLPLLYYKGYVARDADTKEQLQLVQTEAFTVGVILPAGYEGRVLTEFESPWYWRAAELVSIAFFAGNVIWWMIHNKEYKNKRNKDNTLQQEAA